MAEFIYTLARLAVHTAIKVVLDDVTLSFLPGAKIGVVGPNGAGKSSLLKIMAGMDQPSNGDAILSGLHSRDPAAGTGLGSEQDRPGKRRGGRRRDEGDACSIQ